MKVKFPHGRALEAANELSAAIAAEVELLAICGSLRRKKPMVGDIELLFVPKYEQEPDGLFGETRAVDLAERRINFLLAECRLSHKPGLLRKRPNKEGIEAWGTKNKLAVHNKTEIPVDLFATTKTHWWMSLVFRTGPAEFNIKLIESARRKGLRAHAYSHEEHGHAPFTKMITGQPVMANSEREVLEIAGLPWLEPEERT